MKNKTVRKRVVPVRLPPMVVRFGLGPPTLPDQIEFSLRSNWQYFIGIYWIYLFDTIRIMISEHNCVLLLQVLTRCLYTSGDFFWVSLQRCCRRARALGSGVCRRFGFPFDCYLITDIYVFWLKKNAVKRRVSCVIVGMFEFKNATEWKKKKTHRVLAGSLFVFVLFASFVRTDLAVQFSFGSNDVSVLVSLCWYFALNILPFYFVCDGSEQGERSDRFDCFWSHIAYLWYHFFQSEIFFVEIIIIFEILYLFLLPLHVCICSRRKLSRKISSFVLVPRAHFSHWKSTV